MELKIEEQDLPFLFIPPFPQFDDLVGYPDFSEYLCPYPQLRVQTAIGSPLPPIFPVPLGWLQVAAWSLTYGFHSSRLLYVWCVKLSGQLPFKMYFVPRPLTTISFANLQASASIAKSNGSAK